MSHIQVSSLISAPRDKVFAMLSQPQVLQEAWRQDVEVELLSDQDSYGKGSEVVFRMTRFGISQPLALRIEEWQPPAQMTLKQVEGPYKHWVQKFKLESHSESATLVTVTVDYGLPFGLFGHLLDDLYIRSELKRLLQLHLESLNPSQE